MGCCCLLFALLFVTVTAEITDDREDWVDPGDMLYYDSSSKSMKKVISASEKTSVDGSIVLVKNPISMSCDKTDGICLKQTKTEEYIQLQPVVKCKECEMKYMKRFINRLLHKLQHDSTSVDEDIDLTFDVQININNKQLKTLKSYVATRGKQQSNLVDVDNILSNLIYAAKIRRPDETSNFHDWNFIYSLSNIFAYNETLVIIATAIIAIALAIQLLRYLTILGLILVGVIVVISITFTMEYMYLKQQAEAENLFRQSQFDGMPRECQPSQLSYFESASFFVKRNFLGMENPCLSYYKTVIVNQNYEITPAMVLTSIIGKIGVNLAGSAGQSVSNFFDKLVEGKSFLGRIFILPATLLFILALFWLAFPIILQTIPRLLWSRRHQPIPFQRPMVEDFGSTDTFNPAMVSNSSHKRRRKRHRSNNDTQAITAGSNESPKRNIKEVNASTEVSDAMESHSEKEKESDSSDYEVVPKPNVLIYKEIATQT